MEKERAVVILGTAHLGTTPGKRSPDGEFREPVYSRQVVSDLSNRLRNYGYRNFIDYFSLQPCPEMLGKTQAEIQSKELSYRANAVNNICRKYGTENCIYVSVHNDAAGDGSKWMLAGGLSVWTTKGKTKSDTLAEFILNSASDCLAAYEKRMKQLKEDGQYSSGQKAVRVDYSDGDKDCESNFYVLKHTLCPAVLCECMFQDNKADVEFLQSESGRKAIVDTIFGGITEYINNI